MSNASVSWSVVKDAQAGDEQAWATLHRTYYGVVYAFLSQRVRSASMAEELAAEVFFRAVRRLRLVEDQGRDIGAWFVTIARNLVLDYAKSARYRLEVSCAEFTDADRGIPGVDSLVMARDRALTLARCVSMLKADQRRVIELRFYADLSVTEAAVVMGRSEGALKALQHRACRRLATLVDVEAV